MVQTKEQLERDLNNTRIALKEVLSYALHTALASEHFAYALCQQEEGNEELYKKNRDFACLLLKKSYDMIPTSDWGDKIGYLWDYHKTKTMQ